MTGTLTNTSDEPIGSPDDLLRYFTEGIKPPPKWGVGLEYERLGVMRESGQAAPYSGPRGVEAVLSGLHQKFGWRADREEGRIIGLSRGDSSITLEPGGQLELSGKVHPDIFRLRGELATFLRETSEVSEPLGISWIPLGLQPVTPVESIEWVPKGRYGIMGPYLGARGDLAHHMMKGTAGVQINFDYGSEEDALEKFRLALAISPITTAASANSPLYGGKPSGYLSRRAHIWTRTDPERCGFPRFAFDDDLSFQSYLDYTLQVPMMFVQREGRWIEMEGVPFGTFLREGWRGLRAVESDWFLHMTTIFTEVRLKTYVEVRGHDSVSPTLALAFAVLWKGILYDQRSLRAAWQLVSRPGHSDRTEFFDEVARKGPEARLGDATARELALELLSLARQGLDRICGCSDLPPCSKQEADLLDPLEESLRAPLGAPAARLLEAWTGGARSSPAEIARCALQEEQAFLAGEERGCTGQG